MEPTLMIAVALSCTVAIGAGLFVAMNGSKNKDNNDDHSEE